MRRSALKGGIDAIPESPSLRRFRLESDVDHSLRINHVVDQLRSYTGKKNSGPNFTLILCPYHSEKTPSGRIQHNQKKPHLAGYFKCYGCNRTESWNNLSADIGLQPFEDAVVDPTREMFVPKGDLEEIQKKLLGSDEEVEDDLTRFPINTSTVAKVGLDFKKGWRGFDFEFLIELGSEFCYSERAFRYYLYLPVYVCGNERGFIRAQLSKPTDKKFPSYLNAPGTWSLDYGLYPFDSAVAMMKSLGLKTIFLVEGPRDAMRLLKMGIPAVCLLGTHSWSENKLRALQLSGAERIVLMFDGDEAGKKCTQLVLTGESKTGSDSRKVCSRLDEYFKVKVVRLWNMEEDPNELVGDSKFDAGNLPKPILKKIAHKLCI